MHNDGILYFGVLSIVPRSGKIVEKGGSIGWPSCICRGYRARTSHRPYYATRCPDVEYCYWKMDEGYEEAWILAAAGTSESSPWLLVGSKLTGWYEVSFGCNFLLDGFLAAMRMKMG
jgi:hypothetical protein